MHKQALHNETLMLHSEKELIEDIWRNDRVHEDARQELMQSVGVADGVC